MWSSSITVGLLAVWYFTIANDAVAVNMGSTTHPKFKFETVTGFFAQDEPDTSENFDYVWRSGNTRFTGNDNDFL